MAEELSLSPPDTLAAVLEGAPGEVLHTVSEALALYVVSSKRPEDDQSKANKLRGAFNAVQNWLLSPRLKDLNDRQRLFLSSGALGGHVVFFANGKSMEADLLPQQLYDMLVQSQQTKRQRPGWAVPVLDYDDRIQAIARGELVALDARQTRRPKAAKPLGAEQLSIKVKARLVNILTALQSQFAELDERFNDFNTLRDEQSVRGVRLNLEALKKYALMAFRRKSLSEQEVKGLDSLGEKLPAVFQSLRVFGAQLEKLGQQIQKSSQTTEEKFGELKSNVSDLEKLESGDAAGVSVFDPETVSFIRRDADTLAQFVVRASESAENKVPFSASRILVKEQWKTYTGAPSDCLATPAAVVAALEKIQRIHVNVFPRDEDGQMQIPPILIEPIRNYVEYMDDRLVISFVSGEAGLKGPKLSLTPLEVQMLKACGHFLSKDDLYNFRGEANNGTFIGDYSGKVEKKTQVKWAGEDKKFSMAVSSEVVDGASRGQAITDYVDFFFAIANGMAPAHRLSRRKIAVFLRYCLMESAQHTVSLALMYVAQAEPELAKEVIMSYARSDQEARTLVSNAFEDLQVAKICGERDFFINKLFGRK